VLIAAAGWLAWRTSLPGERRRVLTPFLVQLALNAAWSFAFFGNHSPSLGLVVIVILLAAIVWTMGVFAEVSRPAMLLLLPYVLWVGFATYLNFGILVLNS
jgi:tryptophan-rich sensory protein